MRRVFVDTSALVALLDRSDSRHDQASETFADLEDAELVTHGYVVAETLAVTRRRLGIDATATLIDDLLPAVQVLAVEPSEHYAALTRYRASLPSGTSFVDQVSLRLIEREGIGTAFVLDPDFAASGVQMLPTPQVGLISSADAVGLAVLEAQQAGDPRQEDG